MSGLGIEQLATAIGAAPTQQRRGRVVKVVGTMVEAELPGARIGEACRIEGACEAETVGFRDGRALLMPLGSIEGVRYGAAVRTLGEMPTVGVGEELRGRVIDGYGNPIDGKGPLRNQARRPLHAAPPDAMARSLIRTSLPTGVKVIDGLLTVGRGQRVGLMAGSGVGKSTLMGMIARNSEVDVNVIALIGERGREVREFIEEILGEEGLARSVVVVVTSDQSPVLQIRGAFLAATVADWFRDQGRDVLFFMDSATRLAMAQRQIGLSTGEPPTTKGYTPSVFSLLPRLLERAGPGAHGGSITAIYTVLIDGDDIHDPIGDAIRGIVDGHIVLSRKMVAHGRFPAVDVLQSISRVMTSVVGAAHQEVARRARELISTYEENEELVRLGAYKAGASAEVDAAIARIDGLRRFLAQRHTEAVPFDVTLASLREAVAG